MHEAFCHQAIDGAGNLHGQNPSDRLSVVRHHQFVAVGDPSEVLAQMVAKISNADFHCASHCGYIETPYCSHVVRDPCAMQWEMVVMRGLERSLKSATEQDFLKLTLSGKLALGRSQRRSRRFESAHLHSWSLLQRYPW
jgi:hypothetical protein